MGLRSVVGAPKTSKIRKSFKLGPAAGMTLLINMELTPEHSKSGVS